MKSKAERSLRRSHSGAPYLLRPAGASVAAVLAMLDDPAVVAAGVTAVTWAGRLTPQGLAELVASSAFARVRSLNLVDAKIGDEGLRSLATAGRAGSLSGFAFSGDVITSAGLGHLLESDLGIESLWIEGAKIGADAALAVVGASGSVGLRHLYFQSTKLGDEGTTVLAASRKLEPLLTLSIQRSKLGGKGLAAIARSETLRSLQALAANAGTVTAPTAKALGAAAFARGLTTLQLTAVGDDALAALAHGDLASLESLDVSASDSSLRGTGLIALAGSSSIGPLRSLKAWGCTAALGDDVMRALAVGPSLGTLEDLELGSFAITDAGARALGSSKHLTHLRTLNCFHSTIGDEGVAALVSSGLLAGLETLNLAAYAGTGRLTTAAARALASLSLRRLNLAAQRIDDDGVAALASSATLALEELVLRDNPLGPSAARSLGSSASTRRLRELDLSFTRIGDEGCSALATGGLWSALETMRLESIGMTATGVRALAAGRWPALRQLEAGYNEGIDPEGMAALATLAKQLA